MKKKIFMFWSLFIILLLFFCFYIFNIYNEKKDYRKTLFVPDRPNYVYSVEKDSKITVTGMNAWTLWFLDWINNLGKRKTVVGIIDENWDEWWGKWLNPPAIISSSTYIIHSWDVFNFDFKKEVLNKMESSISFHTGTDLKMCFLWRNSIKVSNEEEIPFNDKNNCKNIIPGEKVVIPRVDTDYNVVNIQISSVWYAELSLNTKY